MSYDAYGRLQIGSQQSYGLQPKKSANAVASSGSSISTSRRKNLGGFFGNDALEDDDDDDDNDNQDERNLKSKGRKEINRANKIFNSIGKKIYVYHVIHNYNAMLSQLVSQLP